MGTLIRLLGAGFVYFCTATLLAQAALLAWFWSHGWLNQTRLTQMAAVLSGSEPAPAARKVNNTDAPAATVTLADLESARGMRLRQIELREQATQSVLEQVRFESEQLRTAKTNLDQLYEKFKTQLSQDKTSAIARGNENARLLLESVKPKQSKELIMEMLKADEIDDVVTLFGAMPISKRSKIAAEFKTDEETKKLDEILRRIRRGLPDTAIIEAAERSLGPQANEPR